MIRRCLFLVCHCRAHPSLHESHRCVGRFFAGVLPDQCILRILDAYLHEGELQFAASLSVV
jgi:hypothetical protein